MQTLSVTLFPSTSFVPAMYSPGLGFTLIFFFFPFFFFPFLRPSVSLLIVSSFLSPVLGF
eukprot:m.34956 g.34956  ORF g.34956 m.34956 type:complete len:60 (-) comp9565_c1_seq1:53-232(-)